MTREHALVQKYIDLKHDVEGIEEILSKRKKETYACEQRIMELLDSESKERTAVYEGLGSISLTKPRVYASCKKENQESLFSYLRDVGREDLIKEGVHSGTLSTYVSEMLEEHKALPQCISFYLKTGVRFNPVK